MVHIDEACMLYVTTETVESWPLPIVTPEGGVTQLPGVCRVKSMNHSEMFAIEFNESLINECNGKVDYR